MLVRRASRSTSSSVPAWASWSGERPEAARGRTAMMSWPFMSAGGLLGMLAAVLFIVGVVALILWAIGTTPGRPADDDAMEILRARYARGEIDDEQFAK